MAGEPPTTPACGGVGKTPTGAAGGADLWGRDGVEGATIADEERIHGIQTSTDGDMKRKKRENKANA